MCSLEIIQVDVHPRTVWPREVIINIQRPIPEQTSSLILKAFIKVKSIDSNQYKIFSKFILNACLNYYQRLIVSSFVSFFGVITIQPTLIYVLVIIRWDWHEVCRSKFINEIKNVTVPGVGKPLPLAAVQIKLELIFKTSETKIRSTFKFIFTMFLMEVFRPSLQSLSLTLHQ